MFDCGLYFCSTARAIRRHSRFMFLSVEKYESLPFLKMLVWMSL